MGSEFPGLTLSRYRVDGRQPAGISSRTLLTPTVRSTLRQLALSALAAMVCSGLSPAPAYAARGPVSAIDMTHPLITRLEAAAQATGTMQATVDPTPSPTPTIPLTTLNPGPQREVFGFVSAGVIADYRAPDRLRLGPAPITTRYDDVWRAMDLLRQILAAL